MPTHKYEVPDRGAPQHLDPKQDLTPHIEKAAAELEVTHVRIAAEKAGTDPKEAVEKFLAEKQAEADKVAAAAVAKVPPAPETKPEIPGIAVPLPVGAVPRPSSPPKKGEA